MTHSLIEYTFDRIRRYQEDSYALQDLPQVQYHNAIED